MVTSTVQELLANAEKLYTAKIDASDTLHNNITKKMVEILQNRYGEDTTQLLLQMPCEHGTIAQFSESKSRGSYRQVGVRLYLYLAEAPILVTIKVYVQVWYNYYTTVPKDTDWTKTYVEFSFKGLRQPMTVDAATVTVNKGGSVEYFVKEALVKTTYERIPQFNYSGKFTINATLREYCMKDANAKLPESFYYGLRKFYCKMANENLHCTCDNMHMLPSAVPEKYRHIFCNSADSCGSLYGHSVISSLKEEDWVSTLVDCCKYLCKGTPLVMVEEEKNVQCKHYDEHAKGYYTTQWQKEFWVFAKVAGKLVCYCGHFYLDRKRIYGHFKLNPHGTLDKKTFGKATVAEDNTAERWSTYYQGVRALVTGQDTEQVRYKLLKNWSDITMQDFLEEVTNVAFVKSC